MKLFLINLHEAYMASEQGINTVRNLPNESAYCKYEVLEEAEIELPTGFTLKATRGNVEEIFKGNEGAAMVTEFRSGKYITSLVTSDGIVKLHEWSHGKSYTYDVVFDSDTNSDCLGWKSKMEDCKDYIELNNTGGSWQPYFSDYKGGTVSIRCNETEEIVYSEEIK